MKIGILGGGLSGLTLANLLAGHEVDVLEAETRPGGLCRSFEWQGFRADLGGHILFSKDQEALGFLIQTLGDNVHQVRRENRILYKGALVKYPFENDLAALPVEDRYACLYHFLYDNYPAPKNLQEWCYHTFGQGISDAYLLPYNRKIWKQDPRDLSTAWVERIPKPPKEDVIKSALGIPTEGYTHQLYFHYPLRGGIEALIHSLAAGVRVTTGFRVTDVQKTPGGWVVSSATGEARQYDRIVSTIPAPDLFAALPWADAAVRATVRELRHNALMVVMVCLSAPRTGACSALYVPDPRVVFHRLCHMDYFSPHNSPAGQSAVIAEITYDPDGDLARLTDEDVAATVVDDLVRLGQIERRHVMHAVVKRSAYGYVVNTMGYEARLQHMHDYLERVGLPVCGRFAEFRYHNMDACVRSAMQVRARINEEECHA